jgi:hypothetical protein
LAPWRVKGLQWIAGCGLARIERLLNMGQNRKLDIDTQAYYFKLSVEDFKNDSSEDMVSMCSHA